MPRNVLLEFRRDTAANWTANNPALAAGEPGFETDTGKLKVGDGSTAWASLGYIAAASGVTSLDSITGAVTLTAGTNITITDNSPSAGHITIAATVPGGPGVDGWTSSADTWTFATATTFTISGVDRTTTFTPGTKLKLTQTTVKYFVVQSSSFSTNTTVTITGGSDYSLANAAITAPFYSYQANPQGWPGWFNFTPSTTGITGESSTARFAVQGRIVSLELALTGTGSATTRSFTLPFAVGHTGTFATTGLAEDAGSTQNTPGSLNLPNSGTTCNLFKNTANGAWTASGAWFYIGTITYEF